VREGLVKFGDSSCKEDFTVLRHCLKCVSVLALVCFAGGILAGKLDSLDACGALAASAEEAAGMEEMVKTLSGGYSVAQAVAKCNENKELCQKVQKDLKSRKIAIPKGLTCSK
jgi:hypothetical protein